MSTWGLRLTGRRLIRYLFFSLFVVFVGGLLVKLKGVGSVFCLSSFGVDLTLTAAPFE